MVLLSGCSCENNVREVNRAMVPNPFVSVDSVERAAEGAGFVFYCPSEVEGYSKKDISYIKNKLIQVVFRDGNKSILLRKTKGTDDISGDYNKYNNIDITPEDAARLIAEQTITKEFDTMSGKSAKTYKMVDTGTYVNVKEI